jgi:hypothetical protein
LALVSSTVPPATPPSTGSPQTNGSSPPPLYSTRFKIVAALLVALAIGAFTAAYLQVAEDDGDLASSGGTSAFVERLLPESDSQIVQQSPVGIDLTPGWEGTLVVDGIAIPEEELDITESLNLVEFTPGEGKAMTTLPVGKVCASATVWETATGPEDSRQVAWCFDVI